MAVSSDGVMILSKSKAILEAYSYRQISTWEVDGDIIAINVIRAGGGKDGNKFDELKFQTKMAEDVSGLMKEYSLKIGADRRKDREIFVPEAEIFSLIRDVEKTRANLMKKSMIAKPAPKKPTGTVKGLANTSTNSLNSSMSSKTKISIKNMGKNPSPEETKVDGAPEELDWISTMVSLLLHGHVSFMHVESTGHTYFGLGCG
jgi:hypothetical protein